jgi:O-antigen/teichoic acid export membrane protein
MQRPRFDWRRMAGIARENWQLGASTVCALVANRLAPVITLATAGALQAGRYGAAFRLVDAVEAVAALLMSVLLPVLTRHSAKSDQAAATAMRRAVASTMLLGTAAGFLTAEWGPTVLPALAGSAFARLDAVFLPLSLFLVIAFAVQPLNYTLVATGRYLPLLIAAVGAAVALLVLARLWSASSGAEGAAWATAVGYGVLLAGSAFGAAGLGDIRKLAGVLLRGATCAGVTSLALWIPLGGWARTIAAAAVLALSAFILRLVDAALISEVRALGRRTS